jgi:hypothetical protein
VESEERRVQSGSEAPQSKTRRHRAQTEAAQSGNQEANPEDTIWLIVQSIYR